MVLAVRVAINKNVYSMSHNKFYLLALLLVQMMAICGLADEPRVQEIPLPDDATDITYVRRRGDIRFKVASDMKAAGNFYATILKEKQWTKPDKDNLQKNFWVQTFAKKDYKLE